MEHGIIRIINLQCSCLEIDHISFLQLFAHIFNTITTSYLQQHRKGEHEFIHFFNDHNIEQTVIQPGFWSNCKIITELIAVGNTYKKSIYRKRSFIVFYME